LAYSVRGRKEGSRAYGLGRLREVGAGGREMKRRIPLLTAFKKGPSLPTNMDYLPEGRERGKRALAKG